MVLELGTTEQLQVLNTTKKVKWSTSNKKIVKVKNGVLTPVSIGTTNVTAKVAGKKYRCKRIIIKF